MAVKRKRKAPPKPTGKAARKTLSKGLAKVKTEAGAKKAKPTTLLQWRTAWIDQRGRRAKAPEGEPPAGWKMIAWQAYRDPKGRWYKPSQTQLDAIELQYQIRYRLHRGIPGKRREWRTEDDITQDDPQMWLRKMDIARFRRRGDKGRWELAEVLDTDQDVRNLVKLDKYRKLAWTEVPDEQKITIELQGNSLADALSRFHFPVRYGETWSISGMVYVTIETESGLRTLPGFTFHVIEDWYKKYLRDGDGNVLRDRYGRARFDSNSGVYGGDLHSSWRNRVRDEISKVLRDNRVRFSNAEKLGELWNSGALAKRTKAGYWVWERAQRDNEGKAIPGTAGRRWIPSETYHDEDAGDRLYNDLMSRQQATSCRLVLWIERVKIPEE